MKTIIIVFVLILSLPIILATDLSIAPVELKLSGLIGQNICGYIDISSKNYTGMVLSQDRWAVINFTNRLLEAHNKTAESLNIYFKHENTFYIEDKNEIEVCANAEKGGIYHAALLFRPATSSFGIVSWMLLNITSSNFMEEKNSFKLTGQVIKQEKENNNLALFLIPELVFLMILLFFLIKISNKNQK